MRLQANRVKQLILHDDQDVREAAVYYFSRSYSNDPSIMPLAIQVIEQHGWDEAFEFYSFMEDLVQTDETVLWLIAQIKKYVQTTDEDERRYAHLASKGLVQAETTILERHYAEIISLEELEDEAQFAICQRLRFATQPPDELWDHLVFFCDRSDKLNDVPDDLNAAYFLAEALGQHPEFTIQRIIPILAGETGHEGKWLELFAVRLAGELRLQEVIPSIVALFGEPDDWICDDGHRTLVKIGGDRVVEELARAYPAGSTDLRSVAASIFEHIHSDLSVETCLKFFENEQDHHVRCSLLQSVLMSFATEGIEPARQFILKTPLDPDVIEVRNDLLTACKVLGETFPEFDEWTEDAKHDVEFRKDWYRTNSFVPNDDGFELNDEFEIDDEELDEPPPDTIVRSGHVGRNDPCPCGSGKKFKKCCLAKGSTAL